MLLLNTISYLSMLALSIICPLYSMLYAYYTLSLYTSMPTVLCPLYTLLQLCTVLEVLLAQLLTYYALFRAHTLECTPL